MEIASLLFSAAVRFARRRLALSVAMRLRASMQSARVNKRALVQANTYALRARARSIRAAICVARALLQVVRLVSL